MNTQYIKQLLRNVAEVDPDDCTANQASQLAVDLEQINKINQLSITELELVRYAIGKRNEYVLHPGEKHARRVPQAQIQCSS